MFFRPIWSKYWKVCIYGVDRMGIFFDWYKNSNGNLEVLLLAKNISSENRGFDFSEFFTLYIQQVITHPNFCLFQYIWPAKAFKKFCVIKNEKSVLVYGLWHTREVDSKFSQSETKTHNEVTCHSEFWFQRKWFSTISKSYVLVKPCFMLKRSPNSFAPKHSKITYHTMRTLW